VIKSKIGKEITSIYTRDGKEIIEVRDNQNRLLFKNWNEIQGSPPITFRGYGKNLTECRIYGNTVQNGTPAPENPVEVQGCGERTENLWNPAKISEQYKLDADTGLPVATTGEESVLYFTCMNPICEIEQGQSFYIDIPYSSSAQAWLAYSVISNGVLMQRRTGLLPKKTTKYTPSSGGTLYVSIYTTRASYDAIKSEIGNVMLNLGSTALPYEPYGYKLPLTVNGTEYPIYLGQAETRRRIKKLVLTGEEEWKLWRMGTSSTTERFYVNVVDVASIFGLCSHFPFTDDNSDIVHFRYGVPPSKISLFWIDKQIASDTGAFKSYLAAQYAAGTPVTVWYVLAEPETAIVNEPIQKIGDYSDELSIADIPTINGINTISADTTVQPSEMYIKGKIKSIT